MARNNQAHRPMSIDAMLDMERQEVLALLESKQQSSSSPERVRSKSPYMVPARSPVRSMLDIPEEPEQAAKRTGSQTRQAPVRSMLDVDSPPPSPRPIRSMLDTGTSIPQAAKRERSLPGSPFAGASKPSPVFKSQPLPSQPLPSSNTHPRSKSDAGWKPAAFGPRKASGGNDRTSEYQFGRILPSTSGQKLPLRSSQTSKRPSGGAMASAFGGGSAGVEYNQRPLPGDQVRHSSIGGRLGAGSKSRSPHGRLATRSRSPAPFAQNKILTTDGQIVDFSSAYRRLSDANLAFSSGSLSQLPTRKLPDDPGEGRLIKDYLGPDGEHLGSSEEDDEPYSSDDEDRGRTKVPRSLNHSRTDESGSRSRASKPERKTLSLLAAAEEERTHVASSQPKYTYKSLIPEPEIKITGSSGEGYRSTKNTVHPNTSYDQPPGSTAASIVDSDEEADVSDIKRAQKLSFSMTNILNTAESHRAIRIIYRGEYQDIAQQAEEEHHRLRKYLVASDLSDESTHALEWAIGTVLRDGDTLMCIYCVDEETGIVTGDGVLVPDESKAMKEQAAAINTITQSKTAPLATNPVTDFRRHLRGDSGGTPASSPGAAGRTDGGKASEERRRAVQDITDRVLKLLRKTRLQVRVIVEVLHCKNPKHLITEVIDLVNPTLVVIGSRGRSALKGVILGSFSNYLVTKSSVPVMVARKRLRKHSKYKRAPVKQVNNLQNPAVRSLANAKID